MNGLRQAIKGCALAGTLAYATLASAATNPPAPTLGSSQGDLDLEVVIQQTLWIQNLDDINLVYTAAGNLVANETFCVYSTSATYAINIDSTNTATGGTTFNVTDGTNTIDYTMNVDDDIDASDGDSVTDNTTTGQIYAAGADNTCAADNAAIEVTFIEAGNLDAALPGTYTDLITLTVSAL